MIVFLRKPSSREFCIESFLHNKAFCFILLGFRNSRALFSRDYYIRAFHILRKLIQAFSQLVQTAKLFGVDARLLFAEEIFYTEISAIQNFLCGSVCSFLVAYTYYICFLRLLCLLAKKIFHFYDVVLTHFHRAHLQSIKKSYVNRQAKYVGIW